jgi:hypothetical protein
VNELKVLVDDRHIIAELFARTLEQLRPVLTVNGSPDLKVASRWPLASYMRQANIGEW